jgi:hypothetical protein
MTEYQLPLHVYACVCDRRVVLLDLRKDRYLALDAPSEQLLTRLVSGWPSLSREKVLMSELPQTDRDIVAKLIEMGLLMGTSEFGKDATPASIESPTMELVEEDPEVRPRIHGHHIANFLYSWAAAAFFFRRRPLEQIVSHVSRRKEQNLVGDRMLDLAVASDLVSAFDFLRPLIFTARDACLFHSFALIQFLARYGVFPKWVFGVRAGPFAAHCWVQSANVVFNDTAEHARLFTPIMTV